MDQAAVNQQMKPWGDVEFRRYALRHALFRRRGLPESEAEALADMLALRDQSGDDRRVCMECQHIQPQARCAHKHAVLNDVLQRCPSFAFEKP
jgi:ferric iron reductase protein FhuF